MTIELLERAKTLIDMDMRSGEGGCIKPEYIARSLQVSVEEAEEVLEEIGV